MSRPTQLEAAILATLAWYELTAYPLTADECWRFLFDPHGQLPPCHPAEVRATLDSLASSGFVCQDLGHWQLTGSPPLLPERQQRARWGIRKLRRAARAARFLIHVPGVRLVALANTVALGVPRQESDIDLFLVTAAGQLYLTRLLVTTLVHLAGLRRHRSHVTDRLCLSFWLSEGALGLAPFRLPFDPYLISWAARLVPLAERGAAYARFVAANTWVGRYLPNWPGFGALPAATSVLEPKPPQALLRLAEYAARSLTLPHLRRFLGHHLLQPGSTSVVVTNDAIKTHTNDRRADLAARYRERLTELGLAVL